MKILQTLSLILLATVAANTAASAQTIIRIVGSTAFRAPDTAAVIDYLKSNLSSTQTLHAGWDASSSNLFGNASILANGTLNTGTNTDATIVVECYWTGSLAGTVDLAARAANDIFMDPTSLPSGDISTFNGSSVNYDDGTNTAPHAAYGGGSGLTTTVAYVYGANPPNPAPSGTLFSAPDMAFSDSASSTIKTEILSADTVTYPVGTANSLAALGNDIAGSTTTIAEAGTTGTNGAASTKHALVGIVPFEWLIGNVSTTGLTAMGMSSLPANMTQQTARALVQYGYCPQSFLTGATGTADLTNFFYLTGRNEDSGTRICSFLESQGVVNGVSYQYQLNSDGGSPAAVGSFNQWASNTPLFAQPNISWSQQGHSGYATGGKVVGALNLVENGTLNDTDSPSTLASANSGAAFFIGYAGITDAATLSANGKVLTYDGIPESPAAVESGQYTFWSYEHAYRVKTSGTEPAVDTIADAIADEVYQSTVAVANNGTYSYVYGNATAGSGAPVAGIAFPLVKYTRPQTEGQTLVP